MAVTLGEVLRELESNRYELAVWTLLENELCKYVDQDKHRQAEAGLKVTGCSKHYVPVKVFERLIDRLRTEEIEPLNERIEEIEGLNVEDSKEDGERKEKGKKVPKKKGTRKEGTRKGRIRSKGVRSINSRT